MTVTYPSRRRLTPVLVGVTLAFALLLLTARPHYVPAASSYVKSATASIYQSVTKPAHTYITGKLDPETPHSHKNSTYDAGDRVGPGASVNPHTAAAAAEFDDPDAPTELDGWMFHEDPDMHEILVPPVAESHYTISSLSGEYGKYFDLDFRGRRGINPNIIPHPSFDDKWILVALQDSLWGDEIQSAFKAEMVCLASFVDGTLRCDDHPTTLPIRSTRSDNCDLPGDKIAGLVALSLGPHDARVFFGPENPYILYGSLSTHHNVCLGQWIQDFRMLVEWGPFLTIDVDYGVAKDLQRPPPMRPIEKNYFVFWSPDGRMFAHYDLEPRRAFAQIDLEGRAGRNLALRTRDHDARCWARWEAETPWANGTHQATNSLSVTLCKRSEEGCAEREENTFIMHIFQKKLSYAGHAYYLPYVMLFRRSPPFALYAITAKPFWIQGQRAAGEELEEEELEKLGWFEKPREHHEMMYVTSMNWKEKDKKYHGFLDDAVFLGFGREDRVTSAMDVLAGELIGELVMC